MATLKIKRADSVHAKFRGIKVLMDGKVLGLVKNNAEQVFEIPSGRHIIHAEFMRKSNPVELDFTEGKYVVLFVEFEESPKTNSKIRWFIPLLLPVFAYIPILAVVLVISIFAYSLWQLKTGNFWVPLRLSVQNHI